MFAINGLEILFRNLTVTRITHRHIIIIVYAALYSLTVGYAEHNTISADKYFII